jgi:hypothetical protein
MSHPELPELGTQDLSGAGHVFKNRRFVSLWTAQLLSQLASNMVLAGLMAVVDASTHSATANAILILTFLVPAVLFSTGAGVVVERTDARLILLGSNIARAARSCSSSSRPMRPARTSRSSSASTSSSRSLRRSLLRRS